MGTLWKLKIKIKLIKLFTVDKTSMNKTIYKCNKILKCLLCATYNAIEKGYIFIHNLALFSYQLTVFL